MAEETNKNKTKTIVLELNVRGNEELALKKWLAKPRSHKAASSRGKCTDPEPFCDTRYSIPLKIIGTICEKQSESQISSGICLCPS